MANHFSTRVLLKRHKYEFFLLIVLGGFLGYLLYNFSDEPESFVEGNALESGLVLNGVVINDYLSDKNRWQVSSGKAADEHDSSKVFLEKVIIEVFEQPQQKTQQEVSSSNTSSKNIAAAKSSKKHVDITVTSETGTINWETQQIVLTGNVVMKKHPDIEVLTNEAIYFYDQQTVNIPQDVEIHYAQDTVTGNNLTYNVLKETIHLHNAFWLE